MSAPLPTSPPGSSGEMTPTSLTSPPSQSDAIGPAAGSPPRLKGRKRLLQGFQRISSSPSLARIGRAAPGYRSSGKSMSCVSLSSAGSPYPFAYGGPDSAGSSITSYSTAPTSASSTPCHDAAFPHHHPRIRPAGREITTVPLPSDLRPASKLGMPPPSLRESGEDYFSHPQGRARPLPRRANFNFWADLPPELRVHILAYLGPRDVVRCSAVSRAWHRTCFDGQLWRRLDASDFYRDITADGLCQIITAAGPFVRDLNLRGCVQLRERWGARGLADACRNLEHFSLEGCRIDRTSIHTFLLQNKQLAHVNLSGLAGVTNSALRILAEHCPRLALLNVSWCSNVDTRGLRRVVEGCPALRDLRAGEVRGWDDEGLMLALFRRNALERLALMNCDSLTDAALAVLVEGAGDDRRVDVLTGRSLAPPRRLRHLDLTRCRGLSDAGVRRLAHALPRLEGLQLAKCPALTDDALAALLPTLPRLTHLDLEELDELTNATLTTLAAAPCAPALLHLCVSSCEGLGDAGMLPVVRACTQLRTLDMDNTRVSDLVLAEAAATVRTRNLVRLASSAPLSHSTCSNTDAPSPSSPPSSSPSSSPPLPRVGLRIFAYDCANVTWTGVREILSRNAEAYRAHPSPTSPPRDIIGLKCFYNWQPTVEEHTRRVLRGDAAAAARLERKWAEWMMLTEEAGAAGGAGGGGGGAAGVISGAGGRRRRRRIREAQLLHAAEDADLSAVVGVAGFGGVGRRRRARSGPGGCAVM